ncbi:MAG: hypothetical protein IC227_00360 [Enterococcus lacertideformus]|uniref:Uncharacterized protein n=1 Tax=Enterococcus lacertideformus TaxID=2771493 RepID=A0A931AUN7_9ENTE|nr:hypothetical protein [Enterococcus lacertideformus]
MDEQQRLRETELTFPSKRKMINPVLGELLQPLEYLIDRKKELNEQIIKAYKANNIYTEKSQADLRELHNVRHQIIITNELKSIFGIDIIEFYEKAHWSIDKNYKANYINLMETIENVMKKEANTELRNTKKSTKTFTNKEKKEIRTLYEEMLKHVKLGNEYKAEKVADNMNQLLKKAIERGVLDQFGKYDYYYMDMSKTLTKLGLNKWNFKNLVTASNNNIIYEDIGDHKKTPRTQQLLNATDKELRKRKK